MWPTEKMWEYIDKEMIAAAKNMPDSMRSEASKNAQRPGPGGNNNSSTTTNGDGALSLSSSELLQLFAGGATASMNINGTVTTVR